MADIISLAEGKLRQLARIERERLACLDRGMLGPRSP